MASATHSSIMSSNKKEKWGTMKAGVEAIFSAIKNQAPLPDGIDLKILVVPKAIPLKLSPPPFQFEDGYYALIKPHIPIPPALSRCIVSHRDLASESPPNWGLSGPQYNGNTITFQQRYCTPRGNTEYCSRTKGTIWTEVNSKGEEDVDIRVLNVYQSHSKHKRVIKLPKTSDLVVEKARPKTPPNPLPPPPKVEVAKAPSPVPRLQPEKTNPAEEVQSKVPFEEMGTKNTQASSTGKKPSLNYSTKVSKKAPSKSWSVEEDNKLAKLVRNAPDITRIAWNVLAYQLPGRAGKQCRERYYNKLQPNRKMGCWMDDEDAVIVRLQAKLGNQWSIIATALPGRSDNDVKNRWHSMKKKWKRQAETAAMWGDLTVYGHNDPDDPSRRSEPVKKETPPEKLSDNEVNLCHELLNLSSTLKKPDESSSAAKDQSGDGSTPPIHDDYLYEHILMKSNQEATRSSKRSSGGHKTTSTKSVSKKKVAAHKDKKRKAPTKESSRDQSSVNNPDIDDIDSYAALARPKKKKVKKESPVKSKTDYSVDYANKDDRGSLQFSHNGASWPMSGIKTPGDNDCLTGRGGGTNHHPGNVRYRQMVEAHKDEYAKCSRNDKAVMSMKIVKDWRRLNPPGRFLKFNSKTGLWDDIGDVGARVKCAQGLREKKWVKKPVFDQGQNQSHLIAGYNQLQHSQDSDEY